MSEKTEEYIKLFSVFDFAKQINSDKDSEEIQAKMDKLWYSFSEEEIEWVENWIAEQKQLIPLAPESLDMVDVEVKIGESISPRKHIE